MDALLDALAHDEHPICAAATGSGKSLIIAELCRVLPGRILVATHRKELLSQDSVELSRLPGEDAESGLYSAGLGQRETQARVTFGGVQSISRHMADLQAAGPFRHVIVDECHLTPDRAVQGERPSMYQQVFDACPQAQRIGLSATPYRLDGGGLHGREGTWFTSMPVDIGIRQLTELAYLAPLVGVQAARDIDLSQVRVRQGEYVASDLSQVMAEEQRVRQAVAEIVQLAAHRRSWLCFCVDVTHTERVTAAALLAEPFSDFPFEAALVRDPAAPVRGGRAAAAPRALLGAVPVGRVIRVGLPPAHLCQDSPCADLTPLRAWCQRCHLTDDAAQHRATAARTRRARLEAAGPLALFERCPPARRAGREPRCWPGGLCLGPPRRRGPPRSRHPTARGGQDRSAGGARGARPGLEGTSRRRGLASEPWGDTRPDAADTPARCVGHWLGRSKSHHTKNIPTAIVPPQTFGVQRSPLSEAPVVALCSRSAMMALRGKPRARRRGDSGSHRLTTPPRAAYQGTSP